MNLDMRTLEILAPSPHPRHGILTEWKIFQTGWAQLLQAVTSTTRQLIMHTLRELLLAGPILHQFGVPVAEDEYDDAWILESGPQN